MSYNVLYYNTSDSALVQYNSIDLAQLSEYVLELMAAGTYVGTINIGNTNPIGTFIDTVRVGGVGNSNTTILSNTYTLSQVNTVQSTVDSPMYVGVVTSGNTVTIQENATTLNDLADEIIQSLVSNYGVNSYYLGTSAPADGGTWVSRGSLLDTLQNFIVTNTEYRLWHKITSSTYTSYKAPLKIDGSNQLTQWSLTEVQRLIKKVEERIISTGIGTYVLQTSAPANGTWALAGTIIDVRRGVDVDPGYTGVGNTYTATYQSETQPTYTGPTLSFISSYEGDSADVYTGVGDTYSAEYQSIVLTNFTGETGYSLDVGYEGPAETNYTLAFDNYLGPLGGVPDSSFYLDDRRYLGPGPPDSYVNTFVYIGPATYTGDVLTDYVAEFIGASYTGTITNSYEGGTPLLYTTSYQGADTSGGYEGSAVIFQDAYSGVGPSYTNFTGGTFPVGTNPYTADTYFSSFITSYIGGSFVYTGPPGFVAGQYTTDVYETSYDSVFANNPENSAGPYTASLFYFNPDFTGFNSPGFIGFPVYTGTVSNFYDTEYTLENLQNYESTSFVEFLQAVNYTGLANYDREFLAITDYVGPNVANNFDGTQFTDTGIYTGPSLVNSSTSIVSTVSLWKRIS